MLTGLLVCCVCAGIVIGALMLSVVQDKKDGVNGWGK